MDQNTPVSTSQQPIVPPVPEQPQVAQSGKPVQKVLLIVLGVIVLGGIASGSYYLGMQKNVPAYQVHQNMQKKVVPTDVPTPTPDPTADWESYTSQKYQFSVKYPTNLQVNEQNAYYYYVEFDLPANEDSSKSLPPFVVAAIADTFVAKDVAAYNYMSSDWINSFYDLQVGQGKTTTSGAAFTKLADTTVAGEPAIVVQVNVTGYKQQRVYVKKNGNIYMFSNYYQSTDELTNFQNFLSTVTFALDSVGQTVTGGGVYTLKKYSLVVPADWTIKHDVQPGIADTLKLTKDNYTLTILQGGLDGGVCTYPDKPSDAAMIHNDYKIFTEFTDKDGNVNRRGSDGQNADKTGTKYTVCGEKDGIFASITPFGVIFYDAPNNPEEQILKEMDAILTTLKAQ